MIEQLPYASFMQPTTRIEILFARVRAGDEQAKAELFPQLYAELHRMARRMMLGQARAHTLQATALVNEAYLKLCGGDPNWTDRAHFLRLAAQVMRQILVDHARRKNAQIRRPIGERIELDELVELYERSSGGLVELDRALERLEERDPEMVRLVELRFFSGHSMEEVAGILEMSPRSAARRWAAIRTVLKAELSHTPDD